MVVYSEDKLEVIGETVSVLEKVFLKKKKLILIFFVRVKALSTEFYQA